jgi:hypothetical protein
MWNRRRNLVAIRGFHPRKVDGVPGNAKKSQSTRRNDEQKWHNSKGKSTLVNSKFLTAQDTLPDWHRRMSTQCILESNQMTSWMLIPRCMEPKIGGFRRNSKNP